jgi:hypothetical protein
MESLVVTKRQSPAIPESPVHRPRLLCGAPFHIRHVSSGCFGISNIKMENATRMAKKYLLTLFGFLTSPSLRAEQQFVLDRACLSLL